MPGGYFDDDQNDKMKQVLYPYLMDKAQRRATQTSAPAYAAREADYRTDADRANQRALVGIWANSASRMGSVDGKRPDPSNFQKQLDKMNENDQGENENLFKERIAEERSLGTDLDVAGFVGKTDYQDKELKQRKYDNEADRGAKKLDRDEERAARLQEYFAELQRRKEDSARRGVEFKMNYDQRGDAQRENVRLREKQIDKPYRAATPGGTDYRSQQMDQRERFHKDAVDLQREKMNKPGAAGRPEKLSDAQRTAAMFYANASNALSALEAMEAKGYKPSGMTALKQKLTPDGLEGYTLSPDEQQYAQAAEDFTAAKLRPESGAAIPRSEIRQQARIYMIQPGDSPEVIEQKKTSRKQALEGLKFKAGSGAEQVGKAKHVVKTQRNKVTGQIKKIYDDGSEEIVDGK